LYGAVEGNIRRRDLHKLGLDKYSLISSLWELIKGSYFSY